MAPSEFVLGYFHGHCNFNGIVIHPSIQPKHVLGSGLGVYATRQIGPDEQLIHIPADQVFTTANIPEDFLENSAREEIAVHAQLAAFFAFAKKADIEPYRPWMNTWPAFGDFFSTMPMFWGDLIASELEKQHIESDEDGSEAKAEQAGPVKKKQKVHNGAQDIGSSSRTSTETLVSADRPVWASDARSLGAVHDQVVQMVEKLVSHTVSVHRALPKLRLLKKPRKITRFFHAWCIVNTRCFYYVPRSPSQAKEKKKTKAPADPNEAMGLCPYMDFFNHTAPSSSTELSSVDGDSPKKLCKVKSGINGFTAVATSAIPADTEILFSYGAHTNDTLWSEYGFLLPDSSNSSDSILLDSCILENLLEEQRSVLDDHGYLGTYTLYNDGSVCYRTEMTAWLPILGVQQWTKAVEEALDPADLAEAGMQIALEGKDSQARVTRLRSRRSARQQHFQVIEGWLKVVQKEAEKDNVELMHMSLSEIEESYKTLSIIEGAPRMSKQEKVSLATSRWRMCRDRCEQIRAMAARGVEAVSADASGEL